MDIDKKAQEIHQASELQQKQIYDKRGYGSYQVLAWEDIEEGFYKQHVYKLAQKAIENDSPKSSRKNRTVTKKKT